MIKWFDDKLGPGAGFAAVLTLTGIAGAILALALCLSGH